MRGRGLDPDFAQSTVYFFAWKTSSFMLNTLEEDILLLRFLFRTGSFNFDCRYFKILNLGFLLLGLTCLLQY